MGVKGGARGAARGKGEKKGKGQPLVCYVHVKGMWLPSTSPKNRGRAPKKLREGVAAGWGARCRMARSPECRPALLIHALRTDCRRWPGFQQFPPASGAGGGRPDLPPGFPEGVGTPGLRPGSGQNAGWSGPAASPGRPAPLWRTSAGFWSGDGAGGGHQYPAGGQECPGFPTSGGRSPGLSHWNHRRTGRGPAHLYRRLPFPAGGST